MASETWTRGKWKNRDSLPHVRGSPGREVNTTRVCDDCKKNKSLRSPSRLVGLEDRLAIQPLDPIYSDVVGLMQYRSIGNSNYFVTLLDDCSPYSSVRFVALNSEVADTVAEMVQELESLSNSRVGKRTCINRNIVKWLRTVGGGNTLDMSFKSA